MTSEQLASQAIERSESHNEIVTIDYDAIGAEYVAAECDDSIVANHVTEYWANDPNSEDGMLWRVHMRHPVKVERLPYGCPESDETDDGSRA